MTEVALLTDVATVKNEIAHLRKDLEKVEAITLANQRLLRWGMGAAAGAGAILPLLLPRIAEVFGL